MQIQSHINLSNGSHTFIVTDVTFPAQIAVIVNDPVSWPPFAPNAVLGAPDESAQSE